VSYHEYEESLKLNAEDAPFFALIMAAMRKADSFNIERLRVAFPETYRELTARYNAPGGRLPGDNK